MFLTAVVGCVSSEAETGSPRYPAADLKNKRERGVGFEFL